MSHKEVLEDAGTSAAGPFHEFLLNIHPHTLHVFVEGPDDFSFYGNALAPYLDLFDDYEHYICHGKRQVYDVRTDVLSHTSAADWWNSMCILYFVDKDHSDLAEQSFSPAEDVYVTDYYSFENYLVTEQMLKRVFQDFINFYEGKRPRLEDHVNRFGTVLGQFYEIARPVMVWGIYNRKLGKEISFGNVKPGKLFEVRVLEGEVEVLSKIGPTDECYVNLLDRLCKVCTPDSFYAEKQSTNDSLSTLEPKVYTRGKYELWIMLRYVDLTLQFLRTNSNGRYKLRYSLSKLEDRDRSKVIAQMLHPLPTSLSEFLEENLSRFQVVR